MFLLAPAWACTKENPTYVEDLGDLDGAQQDGLLPRDQGEDLPAPPDKGEVPDLPDTPDLTPTEDTYIPPDVPVVVDQTIPLDQPIPKDIPPPDMPPVKPDLPPKPDIKVLLTNGSPCTANSQCYTKFCVDKVCCGGPCAGKCMACNLSGAKGSCKFVPTGGDPDNDCKKVDPVSTCKLDGNCNGKGGCRFYPKGTVCEANKCAGIGTYQAPRTCDGGGACSKAVKTLCFPFNCSATTKKCYTSCTSANEITTCWGYYGCDATQSTCHKTCSGDSQCNKFGECDKKKCVKD